MTHPALRTLTASAVEVSLSWGDGPCATALSTGFARQGERFVVGESSACDAFLPGEILGAPRVDLVEWADTAVVVPPRGARVRVGGREVPPDRRDLGDGELVEIALGSFVIRARRVEMEALPRAKSAREGPGGLALSFVLHVACLLGLAVQPPPETGFEAQRGVMQRLLAASDARELEPVKSAPPARGGASTRDREHAVDASAGARVPPAAVAPSREHAKKDKALPARGGAAARLAEARGFGMIALLADAKNLPPSAWSDVHPIETDVARVREMFAEPVGESAGGLVLSGIGLAGGGKGAGIPITEVGMLARRTRERLDDASTAGTEGTFAHVPDTRTAGNATGRRAPPSPIPSAAIERVVHANDGRLRACYAQAQRRKPSLTGNVVVSFTIAPSGEVSDARDAGGELEDEAVRACVVRTFLGLSFAPSPDGAPRKVVYPVAVPRAAPW
jgi:hypothetical protein